LKYGIQDYTSTRTKRQQTTVELLQSRYDSISYALAKRTNNSVKLQVEATTQDVNPLYKSINSISSEIISRDKTMLSAVLIELTKNLELAKYTLSEETPAIQIIDSSIFPLPKNIPSKLLYALAISLFTVFFIIFIVTIKKILF
jgi:hypothetical protein